MELYWGIDVPTVRERYVVRSHGDGTRNNVRPRSWFGTEDYRCEDAPPEGSSLATCVVRRGGWKALCIHCIWFLWGKVPLDHPFFFCLSCRNSFYIHFFFSSFSIYLCL